MRISRRKPGIVSVLGMPPVMAIVLRELPELLGSDQPEVVTKRLFPVPVDDPEAAAEWRRMQHPELFALLADARQVVESDLPALARGRDAGTLRLDLPALHLHAWISALNAARLTLGALHDVTAEDLDPDNVPSRDERGAAIVRIDLYAWLQSLLIDVAQRDG
jgi:hypothetical protein